MILRLLWPAARSSRLTIFLILVCISRTSLNWTSDWRRALVISLRHSFKTFSSIIVALLICCIAREMLPPNCANTIFALFFLRKPKIFFFFFLRILGFFIFEKSDLIEERGREQVWGNSTIQVRRKMVTGKWKWLIWARFWAEFSVQFRRPNPMFV